MTFTFTDNFSPPSPLWSNSIGNWTAFNGHYYAQNPSNSPDTYSGLPYDFTNSNLVITVTVNDLGPGGIFLDDDGSTNNGVAFAFGGGGAKGTGLGNSAYWSVWQNGTLTDALNEVDGVFTPSGTYTISVVANGNTYQAFIDPDGVFDTNSVLLTTLVNSTFSSGHVGLYDFSSGMSFSNFSVSGTLASPPPPPPPPAPIIFADNFSPPSPLWSNSIGNWTASNGHYYAQNPSNSPDTYSGLPYNFTNSNLVITVTVNDIGNYGGAIFLDDDGSTNNGVAFVFGGGGVQGTGGGNSAYWSVWQNGTLKDGLNEVDGVFTASGTFSISVVVNGNTYQAFIDPDGAFDSHSVLLTTLVNNTFSSGHVGLYDFSSSLFFSHFTVSGTLIGPAAPAITTTAPAQNNAASINIDGTAEPNSTVSLYNGTQLVKTTTADGNGDWQVGGITLSDGADYSFSATETLGGNLSAPSNVLAFHDDQTPPAVTEVLKNDTGRSATDKNTSDPTLTGSGDPNAAVHFTVDGHSITATAAATSSGAWTFTPSGLGDGQHTIAASEMDAAGNIGTASLTFTLDTTAPVPVITSEVLNKSGQVALTGTTAEPNDTISVYDGTTLLGATMTASNGAWSFTTGKVSNVVHTYTATATDVAGNVGLNEAILGSTKADTLIGTSGNDIINGNGGNDTITGGSGADTLTGGSGKVTFLYNAISDSIPSSHDTITDFHHTQDKIDFTNIAGINASHGVPTFQGKLTGSGNLPLNAHSVAYIEVNGNTEVLVNTTNTIETVTGANVGAANMEIILLGINLHLASTDFHHV